MRKDQKFREQNRIFFKSTLKLRHLFCYNFPFLPRTYYVKKMIKLSFGKHSRNDRSCEAGDVPVGTWTQNRDQKKGERGQKQNLFFFSRKPRYQLLLWFLVDTFQWSKPVEVLSVYGTYLWTHLQKILNTVLLINKTRLLHYVHLTLFAKISACLATYFYQNFINIVKAV